MLFGGAAGWAAVLGRLGGFCGLSWRDCVYGEEASLCPGEGVRRGVLLGQGEACEVCCEDVECALMVFTNFVRSKEWKIGGRNDMGARGCSKVVVRVDA